MKYLYMILAFRNQNETTPITGVFITDTDNNDNPLFCDGVELIEELKEARHHMPELFWRAVPLENGAAQIAQVMNDCGRI